VHVCMTGDVPQCNNVTKTRPSTSLAARVRGVTVRAHIHATNTDARAHSSALQAGSRARTHVRMYVRSVRSQHIARQSLRSRLSPRRQVPERVRRRSSRITFSGERADRRTHCTLAQKSGAFSAAACAATCTPACLPRRALFRWGVWVYAFLPSFALPRSPNPRRLLRPASRADRPQAAQLDRGTRNVL